MLPIDKIKFTSQAAWQNGGEQRATGQHYCRAINPIKSSTAASKQALHLNLTAEANLVYIAKCFI
jgi:hypothetical protein